MGVDLNETKIKYGKNELELKNNLFVRDVEKLDKKNLGHNFDVVVMKAFLEHVKNFPKFLKIGRTLMKKDGIIGIEVPRFSNPIRKILGKKWYAYSPHEHYWYFTKNSCKKLFPRANLKIKDIQTPTNDYLSFIGNRLLFISYRCENFIGNLTGLGDKLSIIASKKRKFLKITIKNNFK